ncbi:MAG: mechanosensitive ion channel [Rhodospirillaceae bacterium]|jgi:small conductance mechanosensitive channel|nr:mechanosensitive ion channel [Rhodospirillaceae bacterium]MBT6218884.1 mechanosensitive ion channel [Rhodospirillaceae bacterium]MBT6364484.1 mechanosensitive ion channel [Rhodospirillaceae bacterium]MBT8003161.1 mechanosensitive ion channel [Rhodospirillales bacterium]
MSNPEEITTLIESVLAEVVGLLTTYGMDVLGAVVMLIAGLWIAGRVGIAVKKGMDKTAWVDETLTSFFASLAKYVVLAVTIIAVLNQFGVETTSLVAVIGAAGLAIGLALQGTLSNIAAGVMLLIFRPFRVGDFIEVAGHSATVKELNLFFTQLATGDNVRIIVPNAQIWGGSLKNFSSSTTRRVDFVFGIAYDADIDQAMALILDIVTADKRVHKDPEPFLGVSNLGDSSVDITTRVWVNSDDYWSVKFDTLKAVKERMDADGVGIPFPSRTVYMVNDQT